MSTFILFTIVITMQNYTFILEFDFLYFCDLNYQYSCKMDDGFIYFSIFVSFLQFENIFYC